MTLWCAGHHILGQDFLWCDKELLDIKAFSHPEPGHLYGVAPVCVFMCSLNFCFVINLNVHMLHGNPSVSMLCILMCLFIFSSFTNCFPHWWQLKNPVGCVLLIWSFKSHSCTNFLGHPSNLQGILAMPWTFFLCWFNCDLIAVLYLQSSQDRFLSVWMLNICCFNVDLIRVV